jgi:hypothetical protein
VLVSGDGDLLLTSTAEELRDEWRIAQRGFEIDCFRRRERRGLNKLPLNGITT